MLHTESSFKCMLSALKEPIVVFWCSVTFLKHVRRIGCSGGAFMEKCICREQQAAFGVVGKNSKQLRSKQWGAMLTCSTWTLGESNNGLCIALCLPNEVCVWIFKPDSEPFWTSILLSKNQHLCLWCYQGDYHAFNTICMCKCYGADTLPCLQ